MGPKAGLDSVDKIKLLQPVAIPTKISRLHFGGIARLKLNERYISSRCGIEDTIRRLQDQASNVTDGEQPGTHEYTAEVN